jgi:GT2 family glycosyltransferase
MERFDSSRIVGVGGKLLETYTSSVFDLWRSVHMKQYWEDREVTPPFLFGSNVVFRREALINIGLYNEAYKNNYEDVDICNRLKEKGYVLIYEPKAIAHHLRTDDICSILNSYWEWNSAYYQKKGYYSNSENFISKLQDNLGLANRYIEEDIAFERYQLLYLDFLLAIHHSLKDFEYFIYKKNKKI